MSDLPPPPPPPGFPPPPPPPPVPPGFAAPPPGYTTTYGAPTAPPMQLAGVGARFGAYLLDWLVSVLLFVPAAVTLFAGPTRITTCSVDDEGGIIIGGETNAICEVPTGGTIAAAVLLGIAALTGAVLYHTLLVGRTGQTWGKRATGVRVVDATTGQPIGNGRALGRFLFSFISRAPCSLGYLWAFWDTQKQTWHDKVVSSVVVTA